MLLAYHGKPELKAEYLARVRQHREADQLMQGYGYWKDGKGCAVGCTIHSGQHRDYETLLGVPAQIAHLEDTIFEHLPRDDARLWPEQFLLSIAEGADLSRVWPEFAIWLLVDDSRGVIRFAKTDEQRAAIRGVADCYSRGASPEEFRKSAEAEEEAWAAEAAARAAWAAEAAAWAAWAAAARAAAWAAEAAEEARTDFWLACRDKLLTLLAAAPVPA